MGRRNIPSRRAGREAGGRVLCWPGCEAGCVVADGMVLLGREEESTREGEVGPFAPGFAAE